MHVRAQYAQHTPVVQLPGIHAMLDHTFRASSTLVLRLKLLTPFDLIRSRILGWTTLMIGSL